MGSSRAGFTLVPNEKLTDVSLLISKWNTYNYDLPFFTTPKQDAPFIIKEKDEDGSVSYKGYCIDLLKELAKDLKFTYEVYPSPDGLYGAVTENGTWNGLIAEIINEVSFVVSE